MFLQHWATCRCSQPSVEQTIGAVGEPPPPQPIIAFPDQLMAAAIGLIMWLL